MTRFDADALDLIDPRDFTEAECRLASVVVSLARGRGTIFRGRLAECAVALALDAVHADVGTSWWDLKLPDGRTIEVKSSNETGKFSIGKGPSRVDLWVFVHLGATRADDRYTVATRTAVDAKRSSAERNSPQLLSRETVASWGLVELGHLKSAIDALM